MKGERSGKGENRVFIRSRCRAASCLIQRQGKASAAARGKTEFSSEADAEPHPVLSKDRERRAQRPWRKTRFSTEADAEPHPVLSKDRERRAQRPWGKTEFSSEADAEPHPVLSKDWERRAQRPWGKTEFSSEAELRPGKAMRNGLFCVQKGLPLMAGGLFVRRTDRVIIFAARPFHDPC